MRQCGMLRVGCIGFIVGLAVLGGCVKERPEEKETHTPVITGLDSLYRVVRKESLTLAPDIANGEGCTVLWYVDGVEVSDAHEYTFVGEAVKTYRLLCKVTSASTTVQKVIIVEVLDAIRLDNLLPYSTQAKITLPASLKGKKEYLWRVDKPQEAVCRFSDSTVAEPMLAAAPGQYDLVLLTDNKDEHLFLLDVVAPAGNTYSAKLVKVFDYVPAPGQFVNNIPLYQVGETKADYLAKVNKTLQDGGLITLGSWGGYVVFGFDHTVVNVPNAMDLKIDGNCFWANSITPPVQPMTAGSCEPGIVQVAWDANGNGVPDDPWYEIKGSGHDDVESEYWYPIAKKEGLIVTTKYNYEITFHKPSASDKVTHWEDNEGQSGTLSASYFPKWVDDTKLVFRGTRLPQNGVTLNKDTYQCAFSYGYVDNKPNTDESGYIDIDWAVDDKGEFVHLLGIDFVRVYSGVQQTTKFGESSPELAGAEDLHLLGKRVPSIQQ